MKVVNARQGFFEPQQITGVLENLPDDLAPAIAFAYVTGWRISEIRGLTWAQIDSRGGVVRLEPGTTKNEEARTFPFGVYPALGRILAEQRARVDALQRDLEAVIPWIFPRADGRQLGSFVKAWKAACKKAGCPGKLVHDLRRTAIRNLVRAGVNEKVAMTLTGHKTREVFDRYHIVSETDLAEAVKKLVQRRSGT